MEYIKCEKLDDYGRGIGYVDGKVIFVPDLLPEEEAYIDVILNKKKFMLGKVIERVKDSEFRLASKCPYENCGCALKCLNYDRALNYKKEKVQNILRKFAKIEGVIKEIVPSDDVLGYRNKITLKVFDKLGYFKNNSNDFLPIDRCEIAKEKINEIIKVINKLDLSKVKEIVIKDYEEVMIVIKGYMDITPLKKLASSIYMDEKLVYGKEFVVAKIGDYKFYVSRESFFQVNSNVTLKLYEQVLKYLPKDKSKTVLDLYCGTGTIAIFLSKYFNKIIGVEINKEAIVCANMNKTLNDVNNISFICADVSSILDSLKADVIVVDPPRAGLTERGISDILEINSETLVYVSCDPVTLARDLSLLKVKYDVKEITLFDMFPNTYHVESVCLLKRR